MTLDEAINNLEDFKGVLDPMTQQWLINSINLGIKALKRVKNCEFQPLLPGETPGETEE